MKTTGLLNAELNKYICLLAHTDLFVVADSGFPVAPGIPVIDLRLVYGVPHFDQVLAAILAEVTVERAMLASEMKVANEANHDVVTATGLPIEYVTHDELKKRAAAARFVVRTAEDTPYSNVLLTSGVAFV